MDSESPRPRRRRRTCSHCLGFGCGVPLLALLGLFIVYVVNNRPPNLRIPTPVPPANNGYNDFIAAAAIIRNIPHKAPASMNNPPTTRAGLFAATSACTRDSERGLAMLRRGFGKPCMAPPVRSAYAMAFGEQASCREAERTISGVRLYYELANQPGKAADAALDGLELGVMFPNGGAVVNSFVGLAAESIALSRFEPLLPKLSRAELAHVAERLDVCAAKRARWSDIILEEGRVSTAIIQEGFRDPRSKGIQGMLDSFRAVAGSDDGKPATVKEIGDGLKFVFADKERMLRENLRYYERLSEEAKRPYSGKSRVKVPDNFYTQLFGGLVDQARPRWEANGAVLQVLRVEVALYRYRADHGTFPATLTELSPTYLKAIPQDPFGGSAGRPLHYERSAFRPGFLLYSVGPDMVDNHGRGGRYPTDMGCDIVGGYLWPQRKEY